MYTDKQHDMMWVSCDKLLDDIGKILDVSTGSNGSYADRMTLHQHCDRLSACFNILTNLQSSTSSNLKRIEKKIKSTGFQVRKLDRLLRYLKLTPDQTYKQAWKPYSDDLCDLLKNINDIQKLNERELQIAYKYCDLTSRTSSIVASTATSLYERYFSRLVAERENFNWPKEGSDEYEAKLKKIEGNVVVVEDSLDMEVDVRGKADLTCMICLGQIEIPNKSVSQGTRSRPKLPKTPKTSKPDPNISQITSKTVPNPSLAKLPAHSKICQHLFHNGCLKDWLLLKSTCPVCRVDIEKSKTEGVIENSARRFAHEIIGQYESNSRLTSTASQTTPDNASTTVPVIRQSSSPSNERAGNIYTSNSQGSLIITTVEQVGESRLQNLRSQDRRRGGSNNSNSVILNGPDDIDLEIGSIVVNINENAHILE